MDAETTRETMHASTNEGEVHDDNREGPPHWSEGLDTLGARARRILPSLSSRLARL
jgi:hypothetical protein